VVEDDDGLPVRLSGSWAEDKLNFWARCIDITTKAMGESSKWTAGLTYVDLFCGPGVCQIRGEDHRFPSSPLIVATAAKPFSRLLLCDKDKANASACETRLRRCAPDLDTRVFCGDSNELVQDIAAEIIPRSLTLAFIDPTGLHVEFETIRVLASQGV
jgi:three-Cys-motif partner protein